VKFFARTYRKIRGHDPVSMREDFCGTAALCAAWARSSPERTALGVDLSQETMNWGTEHHLVPAGRDIASRVSLVCDDVRVGAAPQGRPHLRAQLLVLLLQAARRAARVLHGGPRRPQPRRRVPARHARRHRGDPRGHDRQRPRRLHLPLGAGQVRRLLATTSSATSTSCSPTARRSTAPSPTTGACGWPPSCATSCSRPASPRSTSTGRRPTPKGEGTGVFYEPDYVENQEIWWTYIAAER
jgi:hypothetical protein